jgi:flagellar motor switch protein FliN/FliY
VTDAALKLATHIGTSFRQALANLTNGEFTVAPREKPAAETQFEDPFIWQQSFSVVVGPSLWIVAGGDLCEALGRMSLEAAGIEPITPEDCRSTWREINTQTIAGIAAGITSDVLSEIGATQGEELQAEPAGLTWRQFSVTAGEGGTWVFKAAWSPALADLYEPLSEEARSPAARDSSVSRTFDLLLEVSLPVSVSFGKTSLQIREILKLNTGSIVELNRMVTDPVEVIVNDCVIARGEVVVVDGNYGVRISQLASREERLKTGLADDRKIGARS